MNPSGITEWLNTAFSTFDYNLLLPLHNFALYTNQIFTNALTGIGFLSEKGVLLLFSGIILFNIRKTRKTGFCLSGGVCISAFITLILKDAVARPRPFVGAVEHYQLWWQFIGAPQETGFAFPSGHTTVAMAAATALFLTINRKYSWISYLFVLLTGISRCYLMVHYPSDILGGIIIGALGAVLSYRIFPLSTNLWNKYMAVRLKGSKI